MTAAQDYYYGQDQEDEDRGYRRKLTDYYEDVEGGEERALTHQDAIRLNVTGPGKVPESSPVNTRSSSAFEVVNSKAFLFAATLLVNVLVTVILCVSLIAAQCECHAGTLSDNSTNLVDNSTVNVKRSPGYSLKETN